MCQKSLNYRRTSCKCRLAGQLFSHAAVLTMCISVQNQTEILSCWLSVTYFQFQFPLFVCFYFLLLCVLKLKAPLCFLLVTGIKE